ncbi:MAG: glycosyltransferase [Verrucomicrobia bacterium]|nr:glycosyltransferase [Verrucomicrobiota bacterium]
MGSAKRVAADGKFFKLGEERFFVKGLAYGPFRPNANGEPYPEPEKADCDLILARELGANLLRVYQPPPTWFLDLAARRGLRLLVEAVWPQHRCFLDSERDRREARTAVRRAAEHCAHHPAVFALSVANEIPPDVVRWSGAHATAAFLDDLALIVKETDPECLVTFGNFPPTEYLHPAEMDFVCFNVYLHDPERFAAYLDRLHAAAVNRPLLLGEIGFDSLRLGEARQAALLEAEIEAACRRGVAGVTVFRFTDEWFKDGKETRDWRFGLCREDRSPKPAWEATRRAFLAAPRPPLPRHPMVSVVVATYNGARTLTQCLESLQRLRYPAYEVIVVDDGSTDRTPNIINLCPWVRHLRHPRNLGLSTARNTGVEAARGEIVAFLDDDCYADPDWLYRLVGDMIADPQLAGAGGPNLLPPEDSPVAAAVMAAPGGPAPVLLTDREAEHLPGCNMAFWKKALEEVGGFDPVFHVAGDDVDICWRLRDVGYRLGFAGSAFVWHYRRRTLRAYLRQQRGYGEAEALLERKHPRRFSPLGGGRWQGRIYGPPLLQVPGEKPFIYHGRFGLAAFQSVYAAAGSFPPALFLSLEYYALAVGPLLLLSALFPWLAPLAAAAFLLPPLQAARAAASAHIPRRQRRFWSRPLTALLWLLQPVVRGWARYRSRLFLQQTPARVRSSLDAVHARQKGESPELLYFALPSELDRGRFLERLAEAHAKAGWNFRTDSGWEPFDLEIYGSRWSRIHFVTAAEYAPDGRAFLRSRFRPRATLTARAVFWALTAAALALWGAGEAWGLWRAAGFLAPALFEAFRAWDRREVRRQSVAFVARAAEKLGLRLVPPPQTSSAEKKASSPRKEKATSPR